MGIEGFEHSLYRLVAEVWRSLEEDPQRVSADSIYTLYTASPAPETYEDGTDWGTLRDFLTALADPTQVPSTLETGVQHVFDPETGENGWPDLAVYRHYLDEHADERREAWTAFYHFTNRYDRRPDTTRRVYVHLSSLPMHGLVVLSPLLTLVAQQPELLAGAKIVGPGCPDRADHIIVYAASKAGQARVVERLLSGVSAACFGDGLPPGVEPVGAGIGIADEPPSERADERDLDGDGHARALNSHGTLISAVIWRTARCYRAHFMLLGSPGSPRLREERDRMLGEERADHLRDRIVSGEGRLLRPARPGMGDFVQDVHREFGRWRIDPLRPHLTRRSAPPETSAVRFASKTDDERPPGLRPALRHAATPSGMMPIVSVPARDIDPARPAAKQAHRRTYGEGRRGPAQE